MTGYEDAPDKVKLLEKMMGQKQVEKAMQLVKA
jgi:hypothetical protein